MRSLPKPMALESDFVSPLQTRDRWLDRPAVPILIIGGFMLFAVVFFSLMPLASDVAFFIASADRVLDGDRPYTDIIETNPPLGFWIDLPPALAARLTGFSQQAAFVIWICTLAAGVLWLVDCIHRQAQAPQDIARKILVASGACLLVFPLSAFGQREHFAIILLLPYIALQAQRAEGRTVSILLQVLAGVLAGIGSSFKPYFLLIAGLLVLYQLWRTREWRQALQADNLSLALVAGAYPFLVWFITPDYFTRVVPLALLTYSAFSFELWKAALGIRYPVVLPILVLVLAAAFLRGKPSLKVWAVAALGAYGAYVVQSRGFVYQLLPVLVLLVITTVQLVKGRRLTPVWFAAVLALAIGHSTYSVLFYLEEFHKRDVFAALFKGLPGGSLMAMSFDIGVKFPFLLDGDKRWADSYPGLWMMPALNKDLLTPAQRSDVISQATAIVTQDLIRYRPDFVLVDMRGNSVVTAEKPVPYLQLFGQSPEFQAQWRLYRLSRDGGGLQLWVRGS